MDQHGIAADHADGFGVDLQPLPLGHGVDFQQPHRIIAEPIVRWRGQLAPAQGIAIDRLGAAGAEAIEQSGALAAGLGLLLQLGQEHARKVADVLGLQEIELHEAFDRAFARPVGIAHPLRHFALQIEGQPVLAALGDGVQVAAHRQQEALGAAEAGILLGCEQALFHQFRRAADAVDIFADPVQRLQIAQAAFAVLDIGFHDIARIAHAFVAGVTFGQLFGHELAFRSGHHLAPESLLGHVVHVLVAPQIAAFEDGGADGEIAFGLPHHFIERAAGMAHGQAQIPQEIQHGLDHLLAPCGWLGGGDEGNIDVRMRAHLAAPVSAHRHQREAFAARSVGHRIDILHHVIVDHADQLIDQECITVGNLVPGGGMGGQPRGQLCPAVGKRLFEQASYRIARTLCTFVLHHIGDGANKRAAIDDGALAGRVELYHEHGNSAGCANVPARRGFRMPLGCAIAQKVTTGRWINDRRDGCSSGNQRRAAQLGRSGAGAGDRPGVLYAAVLFAGLSGRAAVRILAHPQDDRSTRRTAGQAPCR